MKMELANSKKSILKNAKFILKSAAESYFFHFRRSTLLLLTYLLFLKFFVKLI